MSFQRKPKIIEFPEGHELHGLVIKARWPRIEQIEAVYGIAGRNGEEEDEEAVKKALRIVAEQAFGPALMSWDYIDEDGVQVPATADGFLSIDVPAQMMILNGWVADADPPAELGKGSASGQPFPARLTDGLPTVSNPALSAALQNLPVHNAS